MGYFAINEHDCIFRIETDNKCVDYYSCFHFGNSDTLVEVTEEDGSILDIECIYLDRICSAPAFPFPDIRSKPELNRTFYIWTPSGEEGIRMPCRLHLTRQEFDIAFSRQVSNVESYYKDGRVEYYYGRSLNLLYIKVVDLTEEEFNYLHRWVKD